MNLSISNLTKTYNKNYKALDDIHLNISNGIFGLLGPNGAGKSTLIRTIATLQEPDIGAIHLDDIDVIKNKHELRKVLGYLPQEFGFYPKTTAFDMLHHLAVLKGFHDKKIRNEVVESLLSLTNLYEVKDKYLQNYSGGMKQRFGIAQALIGNPKLVIVDEPTAGLDPAERNRFHSLLGEISVESIVILSTHIVDDVKDICSNMAILDKGNIVFTGKPIEGIRAVQGKVWQKGIDKSELTSYKGQYRVTSSQYVDGKLFIRILNETDPESGFEQMEATLEDFYFSKVSISEK